MKERVIVFGDAIIAIILTIIVLELPIRYGTDGALNYPELFSAVGIYFISFCFVASVWFQSAYAFNKIEQVRNVTLVNYLLMLFFLSLVPSATKILIEDTTRETVLLYGIATLLISVINDRLLVSVTRQAQLEVSETKRRIDELNRQSLASLVARLILLGIGFFYVKIALIIYLILPILSFLQNIVDREEDRFVATLNPADQKDYFQKRNRVWGGTTKRYSDLLRNALKAADTDDPAQWQSIIDDWQKNVDKELAQLEKRLDKTEDPQAKRKLEYELQQLQQLKQRLRSRELAVRKIKKKR